MDATNSSTTCSSTNTSAALKQVHFDDRPPVYHEPLNDLPADNTELWYTAIELRDNLQSDVRETLRVYLTQKHRKNNNILKTIGISSPQAPAVHVDIEKMTSNECYSRGLEMISPVEPVRRKRSEMYRSLVLKQYEALHSSMATSHANDMLQAFAEKNSQWMRDRAAMLARADAVAARQVYHEAFQSKDGAAHGLGIFPSRMAQHERRRTARRTSDLAPSA